MVLRLALLKVGALFQLAFMWFVLTSAIAPEPFKFVTVASAQSAQCDIPQNSCGCSTCGCTGGYNPGTPECPAGQVLYDDYCLPACPSGFRRYPGLPGLCIPPCQHGCPEGYDQIPLPQCPQGFHRDLRDPNYCLPDRDQQSDVQTCPYGMSYSLETGQCEADCPQGTFLSETGLCRSYYERECPTGYNRDAESGKCVPPGSWPTGYTWVCLPHCPDGTYRDVQKPTRCVPPPPTCPETYENIQGRCLPVCEKGAERDPYGYCKPPKDCEEGSYANIRGLCGQPECPQGTEQVRGQCIPLCELGYERDQNGRCNPPVDCLPGEELVRGQCVPVCEQGLDRDENGRCVPPRQVCQRGEEIVRGQCVPVCKQGLTRDDNGRCVPPQKDCQQGQRRNIETGDCERIPPVVKNCPKNTVYNERRNKCESQQRDCPRGTSLDSNGRCVSNTPDCPDGTFLDKRGRCVPPRDVPECGERERLNANGVCEPIVRRIPQGCPDGTALDKRRKRCVPIRQDNGAGDVLIENPQDPIRVPGVELIPGLLQKLVPQDDGSVTRVPRQRNNDVVECPQGTFKDNNGRCMKLEKN